MTLLIRLTLGWLSAIAAFAIAGPAGAKCYEETCEDPPTLRHPPTGALEAVERRPGAVAVRGWADDPDTAAPVEIRVAVDGVDVGASLTADKLRDTGPSDGFEGVIPTAGGATACVRAIDDARLPAVDLGCTSLNVNPHGALELVSVGAASVSVRGWALDPDDAGPVVVRLRVDGALATTVTASETWHGLDTLYPGYGDAHGFAAALAARAGASAVCAVAVNVGAGADAEIGCVRLTPTVQLSSAGTPADAVATPTSGPDRQWLSRQWIADDGTFAFRATASDLLSGIDSVAISGSARFECVRTVGAAAPEHHVVAIEADSVLEEVPPLLQPTTRDARATVDLHTPRCSPGFRLRTVEVVATATALGGNGLTATTKPITFRHSILKVATFNGRQSALPPVCNDPFTGSAPLFVGPPFGRCRDDGYAYVFPGDDEVQTLQRWGRDLISEADIALLNEMRSVAHANVLAASSGLTHVYTDDSTGYADVIILSRFPLQLTRRHSTPPDPWTMIREAVAMIDGEPHRLVATHWENDADGSEYREAASLRTRQLLAGDQRPTFFGGDLNARRDQHEVASLLADGLLENACEHVVERERLALLEAAPAKIDLRAEYSQSLPPPAPACSDAIDFVFWRGPYRALEYDTDTYVAAVDAELQWPSDHPFVLVTFEHT